MDIAECSLAHLICIEGDSSVYTDSYVHLQSRRKKGKTDRGYRGSIEFTVAD